MSTIVKQITSDEWKLWKAIRLEALEMHPEAFGSSLEEESAMSDEEFRNRVTTNIIFGAWVENKLVGTVGFFIMKGSKIRHRGYMFGMYLKKEARKKDVSNQLLEAVISYARERVIQIHCTVITSNVAAIKLYENSGFKIYGTEPRSLKIGNQFYDEHLMVQIFS